jgi:hypothetical protein
VSRGNQLIAGSKSQRAPETIRCRAVAPAAADEVQKKASIPEQPRLARKVRVSGFFYLRWSGGGVARRPGGGSGVGACGGPQPA